MSFRRGVRAVRRRRAAALARPRPASEARSSDKQGLKVAAAVVGPVLVAAILIALVNANADDGGSSSASSTTTVTASPEARDFQTKVDEAFKPLGDAIKIFLPKAQEYDEGKMSPADFKSSVDLALTEFIKSRDAVAALEQYEPEPAVNTYFLGAADLYVEVARIYNVSIDPAAESLRSELNRAVRRLRTLGDRIYDRGRVVLEPGFYAPSTEEVELRPPTEVPDWVAEGMAAGPPLADPPGPPASTPPVREETCGKGVDGPCRKEESKGKWESRVKEAGFPQAPEVLRALEAGDAARLGALAADYEHKTRTLRAAPDPKGERERAAVIGLGLLTDAEAARIGQVAAMLPAGEPRDRLVAVARRVLVVGDELLEEKLGFERSGLPHSLLAETGF